MAEVVDHLGDDGWSERLPHEIEYGVDDARLEAWGDTDDAKQVC